MASVCDTHRVSVVFDCEVVKLERCRQCRYQCGVEESAARGSFRSVELVNVLSHLLVGMIDHVLFRIGLRVESLGLEV